jgi:glycosyltransferase involved in cell wall biosynthesis
MAYLEALATGTKVIASRVGFVEDFRYNEQIVTYKPNDSAGLDRILTDLVTPRIISRGLVSHLDFELYTNELMKFMETL